MDGDREQAIMIAERLEHIIVQCGGWFRNAINITIISVGVI